MAEDAARKALTLLDAVDAPTGRLPVVVGNGFGGVLLHEAVGHGLEADAVQKQASVYAGQLGKQLAERGVTAYDDGAKANAWGSDGIDDEGTPTQRTTVIDDGELVSYLYDLQSARQDGVASTGNGRRQSFRHLPIPRMTNTYFAPGEASADELIASIDRGLYAVSFGGGQVEPATGDFVFGVSEGYLIEDGKVTAPVRGATLVGNGLAGAGRGGRDRARPGHRHRLLRQGGPERARRRGPAARAHPRAHRGRHRVSDLEALARQGVEAALAAGAGDAEAWVESSTSRQIRVYDGEVESLSDSGGRGIGIRAFIDGRTGYSYGTDLEPGGLKAVAERAHALAAVADPDEFAGLPDETGHHRRGRPGVARPWPTGTPSARSSWRWPWTAPPARAPASARSRTPSTPTARAPSAIANSRGLHRQHQRPPRRGPTPRPSRARAQDLMTGMGIGLGRDPGELDAEAIGHEAADRALALVGARQPSSRRCPVVLDAFVAASFAGFIGAMLSADAVQRGRSLFAGREGDEVAEAAFALTDDGRHPDGPASAPFDGEGAATRRTAADRGRAGRGLPVRLAHRAQGRPRHHRQRGPRLLPLAALGGHPQPDRRAGQRQPRRPGGPGRRGPVRDRGLGPALGREPGVRDLLGGRLGTADRGRRAGHPGARDHHRQRPRGHAQGGAWRWGVEPRWIPLGGSVQAVPLLIGEMSVSGS